MLLQHAPKQHQVTLQGGCLSWQPPSERLDARCTSAEPQVRWFDRLPLWNYAMDVMRHQSMIELLMI